ncbi:MAG: endonuclease/exonuclease/phosphatase family protein [Evtepia gabavorous]
MILCGDLNVAHQEIDLKNPRPTGATPASPTRSGEDDPAALRRFHRHLPSQVSRTQRGPTSWWSYRFHAREKNAGWRIDYFIVSDRLMPQVREAAIHSEIYGRPLPGGAGAGPINFIWIESGTGACRFPFFVTVLKQKPSNLLGQDRKGSDQRHLNHTPLLSP